MNTLTILDIIRQVGFLLIAFFLGRQNGIRLGYTRGLKDGGDCAIGEMKRLAGMR